MSGDIAPAFAGLIERPVWLAWQADRKKGAEPGAAPAKVPYRARGRRGRGDHTKENDRGTAAEARARAAELPKPYKQGGIGIALTDLGDGTALCGVDLDTCRDPHSGDLASWAREVVECLGSYTEVSPSECGVKVFFRLRAGDRGAIRAEIRKIKPPEESDQSMKWTRGAGEHPPAIELFLGLRYFAVTGRRLDGTPDELRVVDRKAVLRLIAEIGPTFPGNGHDREAVRDESRSGAAWRIGLATRRDGGTYDQFCDAVRDDPETASWYLEKGVTHGGRELRRVWEKIAQAGKPLLRIKSGDLPAAATDLGPLFAASGRLFDRGTLPVKVIEAPNGELLVMALTANSVVAEAHRLCQPLTWNERKGKWSDNTLPDRVARIYLDMVGEFGLPFLDGVASAPLLSDDGGIRTATGYDPASRLWCLGCPALSVPDRPSDDEARAALDTLRLAFRTFPAGDAKMTRDDALGVEVIDIDEPAGRDESAILAGLLSAVCRPSLWLAPGFLATAPTLNGSGTGKGLLVRAICMIAFGGLPRTFTAGGTGEELDKRIAAELIEAAPVMFLDNVNGSILRSDQLASVITERPARVRVLGKTQMMQLNSAAWIAVTGNGLTVSEDLVRRFLQATIDARTEDPESRPFRPGFLDEIAARRGELLSAALTIWRWGRLNKKLKRGRSLGSFEKWADWVRDPLLTLGCADPVDRIDDAKQSDPQRQTVAEFFKFWWNENEATPMSAAALSPTLASIIDPQGRGRQFIAAQLGRMDGTRAAGFVLSRQKSAAKWSVATYQLREIQEMDATEEAMLAQLGTDDPEDVQS